MTKIEIELHDDIISVLNKIKKTNDMGIELSIPEGAVLFESIINLKLIKTWAKHIEKVVHFDTDDENGLFLIKSLDTENPKEPFESEKDVPEAIEEVLPKRKITMPKIRFPVFKSLRFLILGLILAALIFGGFLTYKFVGKLPTADVRIVVNSQPLTRSVAIKILSDGKTDSSEKTLRGTSIETSLEETEKAETTGEKIVGEKADGIVTIFNNTDDEKKFKEGTELIYKEDDEEFIYLTKDDITVPPREEQPADPENPLETVYIKGTEEVEIEAQAFGKKFNLDEGEKLELEDQKRSEFEAETKEEIDGGSEEVIMIVNQKDMDALKTKLLEIAEPKVIDALKNKVEKKQKLVNGSESITITKESFGHQLDDEAEELALTQTFSALGLVYLTSDLDSLIDKIVEDFVPEGFTLSTKERVVNVEVLGNTDSTILSTTESDIQVTLKTFVVTDISEDSIKEDLKGKSVEEAQKILGSVRNVKTYGIELSPRFPFFDDIPTESERINVIIERE